MKKIILNGTEIINREELHRQLKEKLDLPDYYGKNLDALWDCLTSWVDLPMTVEWRNYAESEKNLGGYASKVLKIFREAEEKLGNFRIEVK